MFLCTKILGGLFTTRFGVPLNMQINYHQHSNIIHHHNHDCMIIGAGDAGLAATMELIEAKFSLEKLSQLFLTRSHAITSQDGNEKTVNGKYSEEEWKFHSYNSVKGTDWRVDHNFIHYLIHGDSKSTLDLECIPFSNTKNGKIYQIAPRDGTVRLGKGTKTACTSAERFCHTLYWYNTKIRNVEYFNEFYVLNLLMQDGDVMGFLALDIDDGSLHRFQANNTIMATGDYPKMCFSCKVNPTDAGDESTISRTGISLQTMDFLPFDSTDTSQRPSFYCFGMHDSSRLLTDGTDGEGGYLVNSEGMFTNNFAPEAAALGSSVVPRSTATNIEPGKNLGTKMHLLLHLNRNVIKIASPGLSSTTYFKGSDVYSQSEQIIPVYNNMIGDRPVVYKGQIISDATIFEPKNIRNANNSSGTIELMEAVMAQTIRANYGAITEAKILNEGRNIGAKENLQLYHLNRDVIKTGLPETSSTTLNFIKYDVYNQSEPVTYSTGNNMMGDSPAIYKGKEQKRNVVTSLFAATEVINNSHGHEELGANASLDAIAFGEAISNNIAKNFKPAPTQVDFKHIISDATLLMSKNINKNDSTDKAELVMQTMQEKYGASTEAKILKEDEERYGE